LIYSVSKAAGFVKQLIRMGSGMKKLSITGWGLALRGTNLRTTLQEEAVELSWSERIAAARSGSGLFY